MYLERLAAPESAFEACVRALEFDPENERAIAILERLTSPLPEGAKADPGSVRARAAKVLEEHYHRVGKATERVRAIRAMLEHEEKLAQRLELRRNLPASQPQVVMQAAPAAMPAPVAAAPATPSVAPPAAPAVRSDLVEITAPMVATFYRAPSPGDPAFVELGARINVGQTVCILEAMKLMNELESEVSGEVVEILVENGTPVEFGQVLMRVKPG